MYNGRQSHCPRIHKPSQLSLSQAMVWSQHSSHLPVAEYWQRQIKGNIGPESQYISTDLYIYNYGWFLTTITEKGEQFWIVCVIVHTSTFYPIAQYFYILREVFQLSPLQTRYFLFYICFILHKCHTANSKLILY